MLTTIFITKNIKECHNYCGSQREEGTLENVVTTTKCRGAVVACESCVRSPHWAWFA